ncbi:MAG: serine hydrolase domain-containing protein [Acidimicrobiales bacterium]
MRKRMVSVVIVIGALATAACSSSSDDAAPGCPSGTTETEGLCIASGTEAQQAATLVRSTFQQNPLQAMVVGVWRDGKPLLVGALGTSTPGVPATFDMHHRTGNIASAALTTVMLQQVDAGKLSLSDPLSKWFPELPSANAVTMEMLARSQSGYKHYPVSEDFQRAFYVDTFKEWAPFDVIAYGVAGGPVFPPGTSQLFSDTNLYIISEVLAKATGRPYGDLLREGVIDKLGLKDTRIPSAAIPQPVLHSYTAERDVYEESTFWNPSWTGPVGGLSSNQEDMRRLIEAVGAGSLVSKASHEAQLAPVTVGQGRNIADAYYAMGCVILDGWVFSNPGLQGIQGVLANRADQKVTIAVKNTLKPASNFDQSYARPLAESLSAIFVPNQPFKL